MRRGRPLGSITAFRRAPGRDRDRSRGLCRHVQTSCFDAIWCSGFCRRGCACKRAGRHRAEGSGLRRLSRRKRCAGRSKDHTDHLGPAIELSLQGTARLPQRRPQESDHGAGRDGFIAPRPAQDRRLFCRQELAARASRGLRRAGARRHRPVPGMPPAEFRRRRTGAAARGLELRISRCCDARLRRRDANQQPRHAGLHESSHRGRPRRHGALYRRAMTSRGDHFLTKPR